MRTARKPGEPAPSAPTHHAHPRKKTLHEGARDLPQKSERQSSRITRKCEISTQFGTFFARARNRPPSRRVLTPKVAGHCPESRTRRPTPGREDDTASEGTVPPWKVRSEPGSNRDGTPHRGGADPPALAPTTVVEQDRPTPDTHATPDPAPGYGRHTPGNHRQTYTGCKPANQSRRLRTQLTTPVPPTVVL